MTRLHRAELPPEDRVACLRREGQEGTPAAPPEHPCLRRGRRTETSPTTASRSRKSRPAPESRTPGIGSSILERAESRQPPQSPEILSQPGLPQRGTATCTATWAPGTAQ